MSFQGEYIRQMAKKGDIYVTPHALNRLGSRKIDLDEAYKAILAGEEIEFQTFGEDVHVLFQEATSNTPAFYVVVAASYPSVTLITVCWRDENVWEIVNGILGRKRK